MSPSPTTHLAVRAASKVPGIRRIPILKLLAIAEILILAREHLERLTPAERRRLVLLLRRGHGRPSNLSGSDRNELSKLIAKVEPRVFAGHAAEKLSPVSLPKRVVDGKRT